MSGKQCGWVKSSFDDVFLNENLPTGKGSRHKSSFLQKQSQYQKKKDGPRTLGTDSNFNGCNMKELWIDLFAPNFASELAVHKKKIEEIREWMLNSISSLSQKSQRGSCHIALLTGPSGCGKSSTVKVLAQELGILLESWTNTLPLVDFKADSDPDGSSRIKDGIPGLYYESQMQKFEEFLLRASRYPSLMVKQSSRRSLDGSQKIIIVEELPNAVNVNVEVFHNLLCTFSERGTCPLVFVCSEAMKGSAHGKRVFPQHLLLQLNISCIEFNPVAPTAMHKALKHILRLAGQGDPRKGFQSPSEDELQACIQLSNGDLRAAINSLQFACLKVSGKSQAGIADSLFGGASVEVVKVGKRKRKTRESSKDTISAPIGQKDQTLFIFRALGRVLYAKREAGTANETGVNYGLPDHLRSKCGRDRLEFDPNDLQDRLPISGSSFLPLLHQNYLSFMCDMEDLTCASSYLSDADVISSFPCIVDKLTEEGTSVGIRGVIYSNNGHKTKKREFLSLKRSQWKEAERRYKERTCTARQIFPLPVEELTTLVLPFMTILEQPLSSPAQCLLLEELGNIQPHRMEKGVGKRFQEESEEEEETSEDDLPHGVTPSQIQQSISGGLIELGTSDLNPAIIPKDEDDEQFEIQDYDSA